MDRVNLFVWFAINFIGFSLCVDPDFVFPKPEIVVYRPKGFKISIPDNNFKLFAVHININEEMSGLEAGHIARDIPTMKDGRWTYEDKKLKLKEGDTLYYWLYVIWKEDNLGYRLDDQVYVVKESNTDTCVKSATKFAGNETCKNQVIFTEEFDSANGWDGDNSWNHEVALAESDETLFTILNRQFDNSKVQGGRLTINPIPIDEFPEIDIFKGCLILNHCTNPQSEKCQRCAGNWQILPPITSARISTKKFFSFTYGKVDVRAKLPTGDWIVPEIRLLPKHARPDLPCRIDIVHLLGNPNLVCDGKEMGRSTLRMGPVIGETSSYCQFLATDAAWTEDFHVFSVKWTPNEITFAIDGEDVGGCPSNIELPKAGTGIPADEEYYISIGLHVGGRSDFPDECSSDKKNKPWKNTDPKQTLNFWRKKSQWLPTWTTNKALIVDYVKVTAI